MHDSNYRVACLDMEGVLIPELWPYVARKTGVQGLRVTTREVPDYERLVSQRIILLREHGITLEGLQSLIADVEFLPGAKTFFDTVCAAMHVVIVSDAFTEMIAGFHEKLGRPEMQCNVFECDDAGYITHAVYARKEGKHEVVDALKSEGKWVVAVGDAYNDLSMLRQADLGFLLSPSSQTARAASDVFQAKSHQEILDACHKLGIFSRMFGVED
jgi:phosphoserine/homoserine phosphotransferase